MVIKKYHILAVLILIIIIMGGLVLFLNQREEAPIPMTSPATELPQDQNGNFVLYVSNQSSTIDPVDIKILIDGEVVVEQDFNQVGGHNWKKFQFSLSKGTHYIDAVSMKGEAKLDEEFEIKDRHWVAVDYFYSPLPNQTNELQPRQFSFYMQDEPIYFE